MNVYKLIESYVIILFILSPLTYLYISITQTDKRTDYPGKKEADKAKLFYEKQNQVSGKIAFVKGNEWIAGNLSYHLEERPKWIYDKSNTFICNKDLECIKYKWSKYEF